MWTQDVRYAIRLLRRSPGFAATAILTLAVSIGANAAIWSAVKGILVAPLPYPDPDRLVRLFEEASTTPHFPFAPADFRDYRAELRTFDGIAAYGRSDLQLGDAQPPEQLRGMRVSAGFFTLVGHPPALGRDVEQGDEVQGAADVVILSHTLWMRRFQGDPGRGRAHGAPVGTALPHRGCAAERLPARRGDVPDLRARRAGGRLVAARGAARGASPAPVLALLQRRRPRAARREPGGDGRGPAAGGRERARRDIPRRRAPGSRAPCPSRTRSSAPPGPRSASWPARRWRC